MVSVFSQIPSSRPLEAIHSNYAVIDIGTNTFHLLIAYLDLNNKLVVLYKKRVYVFLGRGGVDVIDEKAYQLGLSTLKLFSETITKFKSIAVKTLGTSALRNASNGPAFINEAKVQSGIEIEVIGGDIEAELIYKGVQLAKQADQNTHLIMDIGGGSVEFIIFDNSGMLWSKSFKVGISILHPQFQKNDPLTDGDKSNIKSYLDSQLSDLRRALNNHQIASLVGASGSFEVLQSMSGFNADYGCTNIPLEVFKIASNIIMSLGYEQRLALEKLDNDRALLAQIAFYLIEVIIEWANPKEILVSPYAMKEGGLLMISRNHKHN